MFTDSASPKKRRTTGRKAASIGVALSLALTAAPAFTATSASAQTAAGAPSPVFEENFEGSSGLQTLDTYNGYTAGSYWLNSNICNGIILSADDAAAFGGCSANIMGSLGSIATALGDGDTSNTVLAAYTHGATNSGSTVQFESPSFTVTDNRFYTASVETGAMNCFATSPTHEFFLVDGSGAQTQLGNSLETCSDPSAVTTVVNGDSVNTATIFAPVPVQWTGGTTMSVIVNNPNLSGRGNDGAIDNVQVVDVTPGLHKSFSPEVLDEGEPTTLTFTLINTTDLLAKPGISFTDDLDGLTVVDGTIGGTCGATGTAADSTITISNVDIAADAASCTITVDVTAPVGTYANGPDDFSELNFINEPNEATVEFVAEPVVEEPAVEEPVVVVAEDDSKDNNEAGTAVTVSVVENDPTSNLDPTSVEIEGADSDGVLVVPGEGTWTVDPATGEITFTPEAGFTGNPTPIGYTVADVDGIVSNVAAVAITYVAATPVLALAG